MKTDRFTDIIRRKLESIRPEPTDKDWARMQSTLQEANLSQPNAPVGSQPFSGGIWSSQPWLVAAAAISTVLLITFSIWQRREINALRQTIGQLKTHPQSVLTSSKDEVKEDLRSDDAQSSGVSHSDRHTATNPVSSNERQAKGSDTVYITRYVAVPSRRKPETHSDEQLSQRQSLSAEPKQATETTTITPSIAHQSTNTSGNQQTESNDASFTSPSVSKPTYSESTVAHKSIAKSARQKSLVSQVAGTSKAKRRRSLMEHTDPATNRTEDESEPIAVTREFLAQYELVTSRPLTLPKKNWTTSLTQRARRMLPTRSATVAMSEPTKTPASQPANPMAIRFRAGVSGEIASRVWSTGLFTEVLIGRHLTVGVGLNEATYMNRFITEDDFNGRTQRDFRKEFGRGVNVWGDILNIDTRQVRLQLPLTIGYRIPLNQTLTLLTSAGTYLNLTNSENATFYCRQPQFPPMQSQPQNGLTEVNVSKSQPVALVNSLFLGAGIEWQRNHWVVQATPVITIPTQTDPKAKQTDLNWQQNTTAGLRARLLYQF